MNYPQIAKATNFSLLKRQAIFLKIGCISSVLKRFVEK
jgi:hypothetical protein